MSPNVHNPFISISLNRVFISSSYFSTGSLSVSKSSLKQ